MELQGIVHYGVVSSGWRRTSDGSVSVVESMALLETLLDFSLRGDEASVEPCRILNGVRVVRGKLGVKGQRRLGGE